MVRAQDVYVFKYDYTETDGIKSREETRKKQVFFIAVSNGMIGVHWASSEVYEKWDEYSNNAINDIANNLRKSNRRPYQEEYYSIMKYYSEYSTSTKTTYRSYGATRNGNYMNPVWNAPKWGRNCYTISNDKNQLIIWQTEGAVFSYWEGAPDLSTRRYYKRVTRSDFRSNLDFLYE